MDAFFMNRYFRLNRTFLLIVGIWPYDDARKSRIRRILAYIGFTVIVLAQILSLATSDLSLKSIVEVFSSLVPSLCIVVSYIYSYCHGKMEMVLEHIAFDWYNVSAGVEREILEKYANLIRMFTIVAPVIFVIGMLSYIFPLTLMYLLDLFVPLNETRTNEIPFKVELFIDQQKHFLLFMILTYVLSCLVAVSAFASYLIFTAYWMHACAMLEVVGYMLKHLFDTEKHNLWTTKDTENTTTRLIRCIFFHERTARYICTINSLYNVSVLLHALFVFALLFLSIIRVLYLENVTENLKETFIVICYIINMFLWIFIYCSVGQIVLNKSKGLMDHAYATSWYMAPYKLQKLLIMVIMKSMRYSSMNIAGLFEVSYNYFTSMTQNAMSYAMVLRSLR